MASITLPEYISTETPVRPVWLWMGTNFILVSAGGMDTAIYCISTRLIVILNYLKDKAIAGVRYPPRGTAPDYGNFLWWVNEETNV